MTFVIDTGVNPENEVMQLLPDWFLDMCPPNLPTEAIVERYAYHLISELNRPKTMATVRKHVTAQWRFLRHLAETHPDVFDEFWMAYAERLAA